MGTWFIIIGILVIAVLFCFLFAIANFAYGRFQEKYEEVNKIEANTTLTPLQYIDFLLRKFFNGTRMDVVQISNVAGDAYSKGKLFLSGNTIYLKTLASYTIISHEMGHALQDVNSNKLKRLNFLRKTGRILGKFFLPSIIAGTILLFFGEKLLFVGLALLGFGVLILLLSLIIKLMTISIEKDASKKAMVFLREIFDEKQLKTCKKLLKSAGLTYWADFLRIILFWTGVSKKGNLFN